MDKIFSTRINEVILHKIQLLAQALHTSKKNIVESAIKTYAQKIEKEKNVDVFRATCGAWKRHESAGKLVEKVRKTFRQSMMRHRV